MNLLPFVTCKHRAFRCWACSLFGGSFFGVVTFGVGLITLLLFEVIGWVFGLSVVYYIPVLR